MATDPGPQCPLGEKQLSCLQSLKSLEGASEDGKREAKRLLSSLKLPEIKGLCRELNVTMGKATKASLVERLASYGEMGLLTKGRLDEEETLQKLSYLSEEMRAVLDQLPAFDSSKLSSLWTKSLPKIKVTYGSVYSYLVELRSKTDDDRQKKSFKSMKGYSYFTSGWVENVWLCEPPVSVAENPHNHQADATNDERGSASVVSNDERGSASVGSNDERGSVSVVSNDERGSVSVVSNDERGSASVVSNDERGSVSVVSNDEGGSASVAKSAPQLVYLKGFVNKSYMSKEKRAYTVYVCLDTRGRIYNAQCPCVAGLGESCSHIAALLFYLLDCVEKDLGKLPETVTRTGRPMEWNVPPPLKDVEPVPVENMVFTKAKYGKDTRSVYGGSLEEFEPRCPADQRLLDNDLETLLGSTKVSLPRSGLFQFWDVGLDAVEDENKKEEDEANKLVIPRCGQHDATFTDPSEYEIFCEDYFEEQTISEELSTIVERLTTDQHKSALWRNLHVGRITSSSFHDVLVRRASTSPDGLVKRFMGYQANVSTAAMQWGIMHEHHAVKDYVDTMQRAGHSNLQFRPCGLTLLPKMSFLGATADGLIADPSAKEQEGLLEVKCPSQCKGDRSVRYMTPRQITERYPSESCLELLPDGTLRLKRQHRYHTQVQGELGVKGFPWADFVVWTTARSEEKLFVERIYFDKEFWQDRLLPALVDFYYHHVVPEILFRNLQVQASPSVLPSEVSATTAASTSSKSTCCKNCSWPPTLTLRNCGRCSHVFHHLCTMDDEGRFCNCCYSH